ncbi:MAG TPA: EamA family transporter [Leucothrix mucor]|uniref:EamA family transporter n=1 Tax=Leucothrix mucor TaxID=45248 RepID=A0A7V2WW04_LEUMU|nr:EamA family transporter [Leucothrix mucor]
MTKKHQLLAFIVALIWGTNFVVIRYGLDELPPFLFAAIRFFLVVFPLIFFVTKPKANWLLIAAYGVLIGFGQFGLVYLAMQNDITPGLASLVLQMQVFFSIVLALLFFKESVSLIQWIALVISFSGIGLIASNVDGHTTTRGLILILIAATSWALGNMVVKKAGKVDIIAFLVYSSLFSVPMLAAMSFYFEGWTLIKTSLQSASMTSVWVVLWQTIGNTLVGYGIWNFLLNQYSAAIVTPWSLLVPVFGMLASFLLLGESMQAWKLVAASLILLGLAMNIYTSKIKI